MAVRRGIDKTGRWRTEAVKSYCPPRRCVAAVRENINGYVPVLLAMNDDSA